MSCFLIFDSDGVSVLQNPFMEEAIREAKLAASCGEVPVGAVIVQKGKIIAKAHNMRETKSNPLYHAETAAIYAAAERLGDWRLSDCDLYVTLEPCPMCCGAVLQARLRRLYFGAYNKQGGCVVSCGQYLDNPFSLHRTEYYCGIMEDECKELLTEFFAEARNLAPEQF